MSTPQSQAVVFFDLDGTLLDTNYLHTWAWSRALAEAGVSATMAQVHRLLGRDGYDLMTEITGSPDDRISEAHTRIFAELGDQIRPLPGALDLVKAVHRRGQRVVIVTSAGKAELDLLMGALACDDEIDQVVHGETFRRPSRHPTSTNMHSRRPAPRLAAPSLWATRSGISKQREAPGWPASLLKPGGSPVVSSMLQAPLRRTDRVTKSSGIFARSQFGSL